MSPIRILAAFLIAAVPAAAQRGPQNPLGLAFSHVQLNSADPGAAIAFWKDVIGTATYSNETLNGVSTLGILIAFTRNAPSGPSAGSAIDHLSFKVPDLQPFIDRLVKTSFKSFKPAPDSDSLIIDGPDGVRIELTEDSSMYAPLEFSTIDLRSAQPNEMQAWYAKHFGARANAEDQSHTSRLLGTTVAFAAADSVAPSAGRAIDHLSFEVKDLQGFCKTLAGDGIKLDATKGTAVFLSDPWGTRIELTQAIAH